MDKNEEVLGYNKAYLHFSVVVRIKKELWKRSTLAQVMDKNVQKHGFSAKKFFGHNSVNIGPILKFQIVL